VNRRIVYNRASVDDLGQPWDPKRALLKWVADIDPETKEQKKNPATGAPLFKWAGDVVDVGYPPLRTADGKVNPDGRLPFIMKKNGVSNIFCSDTLSDGPFPEHRALSARS
jgi:formate dehydrogenase major subunit